VIRPAWQFLVLGSIVLNFVCQWAPAQQPEGITWTNPPTANEIATADEIEFVIFAREPIGEDSCDTWEFIASAWEVRPRGNKQITPRLRFEESPWSPDLLVTDPECPRRDLVRLQIPEPGNNPRYRVNLYSIDYTNWEANTVWQGTQLKDVFWHGDEVYVNTRDRDDDQDRFMLLDHNQLVELQEPFQLLAPIRNQDNLKLVQIDHKNKLPAIALYDASIHQLTRLAYMVHLLKNSHNSVYAYIDQSKQYLALHGEGDINLQGFNSIAILKPQTMSSIIRVLHIPTGQVHWIPIRLDVAPGSGIALLYGDPIIGFDDKNRLLYWNGTDETVSRFDPINKATGQLTKQETEPYKRMPAPEDSRYIPESIRHILTSSYSNDHDVALAFIEYKGIEYTRPTAWANTNTGFSDDTERFLLKMTGNDRSDTFFYGDLRNDLLLEIPCPPELIGANAMNIVPLR
jgi:hypothetical protein